MNTLVNSLAAVGAMTLLIGVVYFIVAVCGTICEVERLAERVAKLEKPRAK